MARWGKWSSAICPACQTTCETTEHVLLCPHPARVHCWHQQVATLIHWLQQSESHPDIVSTFEKVLSTRNSSFATHATPLVLNAAIAQDGIGLFGLLTGRLSSQWITIQAHHLSQIGSSRTASVWAKRLCQQLLHFSHSLWSSWNQQIKSIRQAQEIQELDAEIQAEFTRGTDSLLPIDHFYVTLSMSGQGFDLPSVLAMDTPDKRLWLAALRDAHSRGPTNQS